ncbi:MAG: ABC transporter permease [Alphaproteobacteria bacterium]|nr:ABC transporter permease [Alphaproteobacteria bacterium]
MIRHRNVIIGLAIVLPLALCAVAAPWIAPYDPAKTGIALFQLPSAKYWLGTDQLGRDILSRVLYGTRVSMLIGIGAAIVSAFIGVPIGLAAGYLGRSVDLLAMQFINLFIALPGLVLALIIIEMTGPSLFNIILVLGVVSWPGVARLVRGQAFAIRESLFVEAARSLGGGATWIIARHIWPNVFRLVAVQLATVVALAIFTSASLSFLGLGIPPPTPDWGGMVREGVDYLTVNPWMSLAPGIAVSLTVVGFYLLGYEED